MRSRVALVKGIRLPLPHHFLSSRFQSVHFCASKTAYGKLDTALMAWVLLIATIHPQRFGFPLLDINGLIGGFSVDRLARTFVPHR